MISRALLLIFALVSVAQAHVCEPFLDPRAGEYAAHWVPIVQEEYLGAVRSEIERSGRLENMRSRLRIRDGHSRQLERLGFNVLRQPAPHPLDFFSMLRAYRQSFELPASDIIRPVLIFLRKKHSGDELPQSWESYYFMDPLTDPWPSPGDYVLASRVIRGALELPAAIWNRARAEGMIPFPIANGALNHDVGHLTEFMENPALMTLTLRHFQRREQEGTPPSFELMLREELIGEGFALPNIAEQAAIEALFAGTPSAVELAQRLLSLNDPQSPLWNLISRHGGVLREDRGFERISRTETSVRLQLGAVVVNFSDGMLDMVRSRIMSECLPGQIAQLGWMLELLDMPENILDGLASVGDSTPSFAHDPLRVEGAVLALIHAQVARIRTAFFVALELGLTMDQVARDGFQDSVDSASPTARYLDALLPERSYVRRAFLPPPSER